MSSRPQRAGAKRSYVEFGEHDDDEAGAKSSKQKQKNVAFPTDPRTNEEAKAMLSSEEWRAGCLNSYQKRSYEACIRDLPRPFSLNMSKIVVNNFIARTCCICGEKFMGGCIEPWGIPGHDACFKDAYDKNTRYVKEVDQGLLCQLPTKTRGGYNRWKGEFTFQTVITRPIPDVTPVGASLEEFMQGRGASKKVEQKKNSEGASSDSEDEASTYVEI